MLIKLATNDVSIIFGTHSTIPFIRLRNCLENNKSNINDNNELILQNVVDELKYLGWKVVYDYDKVSESNCKCDLSVILKRENDELFFEYLGNYKIKRWNKL